LYPHDESIGLQAKTGYRVLWFTSFKACINTIMVHTGWKNPGHFKFTPKAGISADEAAVSGVLAVSDSDNNSGSPFTDKNGDASDKDSKVKRPFFDLRNVHDGLSKVLYLITPFVLCMCSTVCCLIDHRLPLCAILWLAGSL
jgi:hypothetical protein